MAISPKEGRLLYHITALDNLESIIMNGLQPRIGLSNFTDIADKEILQERKLFKLESYTPFHFFAGTPFAGSVQLTHPDVDFVYLTIQRDKAIKANFSIIPSHPLHYNGTPLDWNNGFQAIDWNLMGERNYGNPKCKEICMAEAIYGGTIKISHFHCIYVKDESTLKKVKALFEKHNLIGITFVNINQGFFVNHA